MDSNKKIWMTLGGIALVMLFIIVLQVFVRTPYTTMKIAAIPEGEYDPAVWGQYYPLEYKSYLRNKEMAASPTGFGGSEKVQKSIKEPEILINFKGMPFSVDYTEDRGHVYALEDIRDTKRVNETTAGACMTCKTAQLADIFKEKGWDYAKIPLLELLPQLKHPIVCANCHDPKTMNLRVINPAFIEAMEKRGIDVKKASREEMRSYVCGQCHAEYYFVPSNKKVVFPWANGLHPEKIYEYYSTIPNGFEMDWKHPDSEAKMLKAQHPDFEIWSGGVHAGSGVSCADCHMPYMKADGQKYTSHWVTSPMKHGKEACRTCHTQTDQWLLDRVKTISDQCLGDAAHRRADRGKGPPGHRVGIESAEGQQGGARQGPRAHPEGAVVLGLRGRREQHGLPQPDHGPQHPGALHRSGPPGHLHGREGFWRAVNY